MITKIIIENFKKFDRAEIEISNPHNPILFIGPNNSGKTTALQALALWTVGIKKWLEKRGDKKTNVREGVTIGRYELNSIPIPETNLLWKDLHVRSRQSKTIDIIITVEGKTNLVKWNLGMKFYYANSEYLYCKPVKNTNEHIIPEESKTIRIAFLPPMSGLSTYEDKFELGTINTRIGEGRTAEVLRNLCYKLHKDENKGGYWKEVKNLILENFNCDIQDPKLNEVNSQITLTYKESNAKFDIVSAGRGLLQTLLILVYMYLNEGSIILLDEPDAHLEILRQRQIYQLIRDVATKNNNQIIIASHSEVILEEANKEDGNIIGFLFTPNSCANFKNIIKSLEKIPAIDYVLAKQKKHILYLEGSSDIKILRGFAEKLADSEALDALNLPNIKSDYCCDLNQIKNHFDGISEGVPEVKGLALLDGDAKQHNDIGMKNLKILRWQKYEIENYLFKKDILLRFAKSLEKYEKEPLFKSIDYVKEMETTINEFEASYKITNDKSCWDDSLKASLILEKIFKNYFKRINEYNTMDKSSFYQLVKFVQKDDIEKEVINVIKILKNLILGKE